MFFKASKIDLCMMRKGGSLNDFNLCSTIPRALGGLDKWWPFHATPTIDQTNCSKWTFAELVIQ